MFDPYRMVAVNVITSILLLLGTVIYIYLHPKNKINLFKMLLLISLLPLTSLLRPGDYESGDFNIHIYRIMSFYNSLKEGILMPSWAAELNATYGNPLFIFNYSLPYYIVSLFHFIGISFISSMKIYLGLTLYLSGIFMYIWIKELTSNKLAAFTSAIFYIFSPYHLISVHFRATLGESTIFMLLPLVLLSLTQYFKQKKFIFLVLTSLFTNLLFLAHPLMASVFFAIAIIFVLFLTFKEKKLKALLLSLLALCIGAIASVHVWISFILYSPYMLKIPAPPDNVVSFDFFQRLFFSPWRYGLLFQGPKGELAHLIGYTQIFVLIMSICIIFFRKAPKKIQVIYIFWVSLCLLTLSIMTPLSNFLWQYINITIGPMFVVYGRLSLAVSLFTSIIAGYFAILFSKSIKGRTFIYFLVAVTIGYTILNWGHRRVIPEIDDAVLRSGVWKSTLSEGTTAYFLNTKWADIHNLWFSEVPGKHLEILRGKAIVKELQRTSTKHIYIVHAKTPLTIKENTLYFPGWSLKSNGNTLPIYPGERGIINAKLPLGLQYIEAEYKDIPLYKISKIIHTVWLIVITCLLLYSAIQFLLKKKKILLFKWLSGYP